MPSIIPSPGAPSGMRITTALSAASTLTIPSDRAYFADSLSNLVGTYSGADFTNQGELWIRGAGQTVLFEAVYMNDMVNAGLAVAESSDGEAAAFYVPSRYRSFENTGRIFVFAPKDLALGVTDWGSDATLTNSGLIAASGSRALAVHRYNGGAVVNAAGGEILAEGARATAVRIGQGHHANFSRFDLDNSGVIKAVSTGDIASIAVDLGGYSGEIYQVLNHGVIEGDIAIYATPRATITNYQGAVLRGAVLLGTANDTLYNLGLIEGSVDLDEGDDVFDNRGGELRGVAFLGWGDDLFEGGSLAEAVFGDNGVDIIRGGAGDDLLIGGRGDDVLEGDGGNDGLYGDYGADRLVTEAGDKAFGGWGDDAIVVRDLSFALVDGEGGRDTLVLNVEGAPLDLQAALATGRIRNIEAIHLTWSLGIVIRPGDVPSLGAGQDLFVTSTTAGKVHLVGSWVAAGTRASDGLSYDAYTLDGVFVLVSGGAEVLVTPDAPANARGLQPIAGDSEAPLAGSAPGADLSPSHTIADGFEITTSFVIEADETWSTALPVGVLTLSSGADLTNHGLITGASPVNGSIGVFVEVGGRIYNTGEIAAASPGNPASLPFNINNLAVYGIGLTAANLNANVTGLLVSQRSGPALNTGLIHAESGVTVATGFKTWGQDEVRNGGFISATSSQFAAVGFMAANGGRLINTGTIEAHGALAAYGLIAGGHSTVIETSGHIVATAADPGSAEVGVSLYGAGVVLNNSGVIEARVAVETGGMTAAFYLRNTGEILGDVILDSSTFTTTYLDDLVLNAGGLISGSVTLGAGRDIYAGAAGRVTGEVHGGDREDLLIGGDQAEILHGDAGDDLLWGGGGGDTLVGGAGADVFLYTSANAAVSQPDRILDFQTGVDIIDLSAFAPTSVAFGVSGGVTTLTASRQGEVLTIEITGAIVESDVIVSRPQVQSGTDDTDLMVAAASGSLSGAAGDDALVGSNGNDRLDGGTGGDAMWGGLGDDTYVVDSDNDRIVELEGQGRDTVEILLRFNYTLGDNIENGILFDGYTLIGNAGDNALTGNERDNTLSGGAGSDQLFGMAGSDVLIGGGASGAADYLYGGAGHDTYYVASTLSYPLDLVFEGVLFAGSEAGANDVDSIHSTSQYFWDYYSVGEVLYIDNAIDGGAYLVGGKDVASKTIYGSSGTDYISTYGGDARVDAGAGSDAISFSLYGLDESYRGANTVVMKAGSGADYVYDFRSGTDHIDLTAFHFGITGQQVLDQAVNVDNPGTADDYCYFYLTSAGGVDNFIVFMGLLSSQLQASDFVT